MTLKHELCVVVLPCYFFLNVGLIIHVQIWLQFLKDQILVLYRTNTNIKYSGNHNYLHLVSPLIF